MRTFDLVFIDWCWEAEMTIKQLYKIVKVVKFNKAVVVTVRSEEIPTLPDFFKLYLKWIYEQLTLPLEESSRQC